MFHRIKYIKCAIHRFLFNGSHHIKRTVVSHICCVFFLRMRTLMRQDFNGFSEGWQLKCPLSGGFNEGLFLHGGFPLPYQWWMNYFSSASHSIKVMNTWCIVWSCGPSSLLITADHDHLCIDDQELRINTPMKIGFAIQVAMLTHIIAWVWFRGDDMTIVVFWFINGFP